MTSKPLLLLDVDGVLSPFLRDDASDADATWWSDFAEPAEGLDHHAPVSRQMAAQIAALPAQRVWCTTWLHAANQYLAPYFRWGPLPVLEPPLGEEWALRNHVWKLLAARDYVAAVQPPAVVWVDDEVEGASELAFSVSRSKDVLFGTVPYLLVRPNRYVGLTEPQLREIGAWLHEHAQGPR